MPTIALPTKRLQSRPSKICAKCGPTRRKLVRHHVEVQRCMLPYVPEWRLTYRKFLPSEVVNVCSYCHRIIHGFECDGLYDEAMSEWAHASYYDYRCEKVAREVASTCSAVFWQWLDEDSFAKRTRQLRWSDDPSRRDGPLLNIASTSSHTPSVSTPSPR